MTHPTPSSDDASARPRSGSAPGMPGWVKVFGVIALALLVLFVVLHLAGGGFGPGSHLAPAGGH